MQSVESKWVCFCLCKPTGTRYKEHVQCACGNMLKQQTRYFYFYQNSKSKWKVAWRHGLSTPSPTVGGTVCMFCSIQGDIRKIRSGIGSLSSSKVFATGGVHSPGVRARSLWGVFRYFISTCTEDWCWPCKKAKQDDPVPRRFSLGFRLQPTVQPLSKELPSSTSTTTGGSLAWISNNFTTYIKTLLAWQYEW